MSNLEINVISAYVKATDAAVESDGRTVTRRPSIMPTNRETTLFARVAAAVRRMLVHSVRAAAYRRRIADLGS